MARSRSMGSCARCMASSESLVVSRTCSAFPRPASIGGGGGAEKKETFLTKADFVTWPTRDFDEYASPSGRALDPKSRAAQQVETCEINAANMARMFPAVYGDGLLQERLGAIE